MSPIAIFWFMLATAFILYKLKRRKACKFFIAAALLQMFLFTVTPLSTYLMRSLEQEYPPFDTSLSSKKLPILVLGCGHTNDPTLPAIHRLSVPATNRIAEGVRLYNLSGGCPIVFSGFSRSNKTPHATVMAQTAVSMGVKPSDTLMLRFPSSTWEEAKAYKKRFGTDKEFILVTSAAHIPRAMEVFRRMGMRPIPAPSNYMIKYDPEFTLYNWWPSSYKAVNTEISLHEYIGAWYYRWFKEE
ncbi:MAG: hypothetical protein EOO45_19065 [Flavobacterium sp.]|nr:MAG: hypothetical protein EOO45_19065 [Flavobacterium sp.]